MNTLTGWCVLFTAVGGLLAGNSAAQTEYPTKPIRLILSVAPGGGADAVGRAIAQKVSASLKRPVVVDNRPGAGGRVAAEMVTKSAPDGYTLLLGTTTTLVFAPALYPELAYDPVKDFSPISPLASAAYVLVVHPSIRARSVKELVALARADPTALKYASSGGGGPAHLGAELLNYMTGIKTLHVPYKGSGPGTMALVSGETDMMFSNVLPALPMIKAERLRALGISSLKRSAILPEVPTIAESGLPGFEVYIFYGLVAPARTPTQIIERLHAEASSAIRAPDVRQRLSADGGEPMTGTPAEFSRIISAEFIKWSKVIKSAGIRGE